MKMYNFSAGISMKDIFLSENLVLGGNTTKILLPVGILAGDSGGEFFPWRDPGEDGILGGFLTEMHGGMFSREGSRREN